MLYKFADIKRAANQADVARNRPLVIETRQDPKSPEIWWQEHREPYVELMETVPSWSQPGR